MRQENAFKTCRSIGEAIQGQRGSHDERLADLFHHQLSEIRILSRHSNQLDHIVESLLNELGHRGNEIHIRTDTGFWLEFLKHYITIGFAIKLCTKSYGSTLEHWHSLANQRHNSLSDGWVWKVTTWRQDTLTGEISQMIPHRIQGIRHSVKESHQITECHMIGLQTIWVIIQQLKKLKTKRKRTMAINKSKRKDSPAV